MTTGSVPAWDWRSEGFKAPPVRTINRRPLSLFRVWGGTASEMGNPARPGVCLSLEAPTTRRGAEGLFSVWEWGNTCSHITEFEVAPGATLFVGKAHPGDFYQGSLGAPGSQVFIETAEMRRVARKVRMARPLANDMGPYTVVSNRDPGRQRSS